VPDLRQLVARQNRPRRFLLALVDHARARLLDVVDGELVDEHDIADPRPRAVDRKRGGRAGGFQAAAGAVADRHVHEVSVLIRDLLEQGTDQRLVLGGVGDAVAAVAPWRRRRAAPSSRTASTFPSWPRQPTSSRHSSRSPTGWSGPGCRPFWTTPTPRLGRVVPRSGSVRPCGRSTTAVPSSSCWACVHCGEPNRAVADVVAHVIVTALRQHATVEIVPANAIPWPDPVASVARF
jgi:hypothetical protein